MSSFVSLSGITISQTSMARNESQISDVSPCVPVTCRHYTPHDSMFDYFQKATNCSCHCGRLLLVSEHKTHEGVRTSRRIGEQLSNLMSTCSCLSSILESNDAFVIWNHLYQSLKQKYFCRPQTALRLLYKKRGCNSIIESMHPHPLSVHSSLSMRIAYLRLLQL